METLSVLWPYVAVPLAFLLGSFLARRQEARKRATELGSYSAAFVDPASVNDWEERALEKLDGYISDVKSEHPDWTISEIIHSDAGREAMFQWLLAHHWTGYRLESLRQAKIGTEGVTLQNYTLVVEKAVAPAAMGVLLDRFIEQMEPWLEKRFS